MPRRGSLRAGGAMAAATAWPWAARAAEAGSGTGSLLLAVGVGAAIALAAVGRCRCAAGTVGPPKHRRKRSPRQVLSGGGPIRLAASSQIEPGRLAAGIATEALRGRLLWEPFEDGSVLDDGEGRVPRRPILHCGPVVRLCLPSGTVVHAVRRARPVSLRRAARLQPGSHSRARAEPVAPAADVSATAGGPRTRPARAGRTHARARQRHTGTRQLRLLGVARPARAAADRRRLRNHRAGGLRRSGQAAGRGRARSPAPHRRRQPADEHDDRHAARPVAHDEPRTEARAGRSFADRARTGGRPPHAGRRRARWTSSLRRTCAPTAMRRCFGSCCRTCSATPTSSLARNRRRTRRSRRPHRRQRHRYLLREGQRRRVRHALRARRCSGCSSGCTAQTSFPAPASDSPLCRRSSAGTAGGSGRRRSRPRTTGHGATFYFTLWESQPG